MHASNDELLVVVSDRSRWKSIEEAYVSSGQQQADMMMMYLAEKSLKILTCFIWIPYYQFKYLSSKTCLTLRLVFNVWLKEDINWTRPVITVSTCNTSLERSFD